MGCALLHRCIQQRCGRGCVVWRGRGLLATSCACGTACGRGRKESAGGGGEGGTTAYRLQVHDCLWLQVHGCVWLWVLDCIGTWPCAGHAPGRALTLGHMCTTSCKALGHMCTTTCKAPGCTHTHDARCARAHAHTRTHTHMCVCLAGARYGDPASARA